MTDPQERLIAALVADLRPIRRPARSGPLLALWLSLAIPYSAAILAATGPFRDGAFRALLTLPAFAAETLVAALAVAALGSAGLLSAIPGAAGSWRTLGGPLTAVAAWLAFYAAGLAGLTAHPASDLGHREHCFALGLLIAVPNLALLLWLARRLAPQRPALTGALAGAAAAAVPAAIMQLACMYAPSHILAYHLTPVLIGAIAGALLGPRLLRQCAEMPPRRRGARLH